MNPPSMERELFLEHCVELAAEWSATDDKVFQDFFSTETGQKTLGMLYLMWKRKTTVGVTTLTPSDPHLCAAQAADLQGQIRGIILCVDRLMELGNVYAE